MRKLTALGACILGAGALAACTTTDPYTGQVVRNNTGTGAIAAALGGAALGYLTNTNRSEQGRKNALIGAGIGALAGAGVGNYMDRQQAELRRELAGSGVEVQRQGDNIVLQMPSDVTFGFDRSDIQPQFYDTLASVARSLNEYPQTLVDVVGHADSIGRADYNQQLSERRALAVADNLTNRGGVLRDRLYVDGRGSSQPIATNDTEEGRAKNRRVEIILRPYTG